MGRTWKNHGDTLGCSSLFRVMVRMDTASWNYTLGGWNYSKLWLEPIYIQE